MHSVYLGLDLGSKSIGVAVSVDGNVATGVTTISRDHEHAYKPALKALKAIVRTYHVTHIVLGDPKHMDGTNSQRSNLTHDFKEKLAKYIKSLHIILWDERLSTRAVARTHTGSKDDYDDKVDQMAAIYILQGYLDYKNKKELTMSKREHEPIAWNDDFDDAEETQQLIILDEDDNEIPLEVLTAKEVGDITYILAVEEESSEVSMYKLTPSAESTDEIDFELIDDEHEEFDAVFEMFKDDFDALGIDIDEEL